MRARTPLAAASAVAAVLAIAGCGGAASSAGNEAAPVDPNAAEVSPPGDIPDDQAFVAYSPTSGGYTVKIPEGWARDSSGPGVAFTDKLNEVRVETVAANGPPTLAQARSSIVPRLAGSVSGFTLTGTSTVQRPAGKGLLVTYTADSNPDPVTGKTTTDAVERYVFFHAGKDVVLTLSGPKGADNVDPWRTVTDSLTWTQP